MIEFIVIKRQKFRCSPIDTLPGQRERIKYDRVQAEVCDKSSWGLVVADENV